MNIRSESLKIFSEEVVQAHLLGDFHINYLEHPRKAESIGWSFEKEDQKTSVNDWFEALSRVINKNQGQWLKQTINKFDIILAKLTENRHLNQKQISEKLAVFLSCISVQNEEHHLSFIFNLSNDKFYNMVNKAFIETLLKLNDLGTFNLSPLYMIPPKCTRYNQTLDYAIAYAFKYGTPVFLKPQLAYNKEYEELAFRQGGFLGDITGKGRICSVTLNLPRIGYSVNDEDLFYERMHKLSWLASKCIEEKRYFLEKECGFASLDEHFSVISIVGVNEALENLIGCGISTIPGKAVTYKILEALRETIREIIDKTGHPYSLEAGVSMQASHRLAQLDKEKHPEILTSGVEIPFYTHSSELPSYYSDDLWDALEHQKKMQSLYTGGTTFQVYLPKKIKFNQGCRLLFQRIQEQFDYQSVVFNPFFYLCKVHGYTTTNKCEKCGKPTTLYRRVAGVISRMNLWDDGQKEEFLLRKNFDVKSW